jgi:hypothetical protein
MWPRSPRGARRATKDGCRPGSPPRQGTSAAALLAARKKAPTATRSSNGDRRFKKRQHGQKTRIVGSREAHLRRNAAAVIHTNRVRGQGMSPSCRARFRRVQSRSGDAGDTREQGLASASRPRGQARKDDCGLGSSASGARRIGVSRLYHAGGSPRPAIQALPGGGVWGVPGQIPTTQSSALDKFQR